jgi:hypothetical protein
MFNRIHQKLGTAGFIISIVALVAALGGGAYAASGGLNGTQKKEVEKIAKKFSGKPGAPGATGPSGPAGPAGVKGDAGGPGGAGSNGKSVSVTPVSIGAPGACEESGGAMVKQEGSSSGAEVCNGLEGPQGPAGSPWTVNGLPAGKTEMGAWAVGLNTGGATDTFEPVSFTVPLAEGKTVSVHFVNTAGMEEDESEANPATVCTGTSAHPTAPAGTLCVYETQVGGTTYEYSFPAMGGAQRTASAAGTILTFAMAANGSARGVWVLTAPTS